MDQLPNHSIYTASDFKRYYSGEMTEREMHALEKAAMEDPFLSDALEGYAFTTTPVEDIKSIKEKLTGQHSKKNIVVTGSFGSWGWMRIAAILVVVLGAGLLVYRFNSTKNDKTLASNAPIGKPPKQDSVYQDGITSGNEPIASTMTVPEPPKKSNADLITSGSTEPKDLAVLTSPEMKPSSALESIQQPTPVFENDNRRVESNNDFKDMATLEKAAKDKYRNVLTDTTSPGAYSRIMTGKKPGPAPLLFEGKIVDNTGNAIPFATITDVKMNTVANSNEDGVFRLRSTDSNTLAKITAVGYDTRQQKLKANNQQTIVLEPSNQQLSEVVVTASGNEKIKKQNASVRKMEAKEIAADLSIATPVNGWIAFQQYLSDSMRVIMDDKGKPCNGQVVLEFRINKKGRPEKIRLKQSLQKNCNQEAIRLIESGPSWIITKERQAQVTVHF